MSEITRRSLEILWYMCLYVVYVVNVIAQYRGRRLPRQPATLWQGTRWKIVCFRPIKCVECLFHLSDVLVILLSPSCVASCTTFMFRLAGGKNGAAFITCSRWLPTSRNTRLVEVQSQRVECFMIYRLVKDMACSTPSPNHPVHPSVYLVNCVIVFIFQLYFVQFFCLIGE